MTYTADCYDPYEAAAQAAHDEWMQDNAQPEPDCCCDVVDGPHLYTRACY